MHIIYYNGIYPEDHGAAFQELIRRRYPQAQVRRWQEGDVAAADYALVWNPPVQMLAGRDSLKAIFALGAGVDVLMKQSATIPAAVPIIRLEDAGMGEQMADYVSHAVVRYFRQLDRYARQAAQQIWQAHDPNSKAQFKVAVLGLGVLGSVIVERLKLLHFPVLGWSRHLKSLPGVDCYSGSDGLKNCLAQASVVVNILPLTEATRHILNRDNLSQLPQGAVLINVGRGAHLVEADLLALMASGHIAAATLDVVQTEPLPPDHPFWSQPGITITPHISAQSLLLDEGDAQIAEKLHRLEQGLPVTGAVDRHQGY